MLAALERGAVGGRPAAAPADRLALARLVTFFAGATPRTVALASARDADGCLSAPALEHAISALSPAAPLPSDLSPDAPLLLDALLELLEGANAELRARVGRTGDRSASLAKITDASCPWEDNVKALGIAAVAAAWHATADKHSRPRGDARYLDRLLNEIADAGLLQRRGAEVWPVAAAQVVFARDKTFAEVALAAVARAREVAGPLLGDAARIMVGL